MEDEVSNVSQKTKTIASSVTVDANNSEWKKSMESIFKSEELYPVKTVKEYISTVTDLVNLKEQDSQMILYRGENQAFPTILPGIYRDPAFVRHESSLLTEMRSLQPDFFAQELPFISTLALLQHHGLPTRALDLTGNALIALFFACQEAPSGLKKDNTTGSVLLFVADSQSLKKSEDESTVYTDRQLIIEQKNVENGTESQKIQHKASLKSAISDSVAIVATLARFSARKQTDFYEAFESAIANENELKEKLDTIGANTHTSLENEYNSFFKEFDKLCEKNIKEIRKNFNNENCVKDLSREIRRTVPSFTNQDIDPLDLYRDMMVHLDQTDPRILRQDGYLLLTGNTFSAGRIGYDTAKYRIKKRNKNPMDKIIKEINMRIKKMRLMVEKKGGRSNKMKPIRIIVNKDDKKKIIDELSLLGISDGTVYPDTDHKANTVANKIKNLH